MRLHIPFGFALLVVVTSLAAAGDDKDNAIKEDRKTYEGTWQVVSLEVDGNKSAEEDAKKITVVNEADGKWAIEVEGKGFRALEGIGAKIVALSKATAWGLQGVVKDPDGRSVVVTQRR
jgi:hypothetical protein